MKKIVLIVSFVALLIADSRLEKLIVAGPAANVSHPLIVMIENGALDSVAKKVEFVLWKNPDELRALVATKSVDFVAVPSNVGAMLYNRGVDVQLVGVSIWGILEIVSRDASIKSVTDLKGKELVVPFKNDMPDLLLNALISRAGIAKNEITLKYLPTPIDAMQHLITRRADHVLLAEPATSMALRKTKSFPVSVIAPELHRAFGVENEWGKVFGVEAKIPQAGIAVVGDKDKALISHFWSEYTKAVKWYDENRELAGAMVAKKIPQLTSEAVADSVAHIKLQAVNAQDAKPALISLYNVLMSGDIKSVGGKLPADQFYFVGE